MRSRLLAVPVVIAIGCCACTVAGEDSGTKLMLHVDNGMTEQQVLALVGPPSTTGQPSVICAQHRDSVREMLYHTRTVWLGGLFEGPVIDSAYVCLDASSKVVQTGLIDY